MRGCLQVEKEKVIFFVPDVPQNNLTGYALVEK